MRKIIKAPRREGLRVSVGEVRALLLKPWHHDYFGAMEAYGEAEVRAVWEAERDTLLAEFTGQYAGTVSWDLTGGKPLGWHLFDEQKRVAT